MLVDGLRMFEKKTKGQKQFSNSRVNTAWSCSHSGSCDLVVMKSLLLDEIQNIKGYQARTMVQHMNAFCPIGVELSEVEYQSWFTELKYYLENKGK